MLRIKKYFYEKNYDSDDECPLFEQTLGYDGSTLANYSYLSDGTKLSATDGNGKGLVYRGPFVYRKSSGSSSLKLESAAYSGGRVTPGRALLYVTDYLCRPRQLLLESPSATATPARRTRI